MAFISMVFASTVLIVLILGLAALLIGLILDIVWYMRSRTKKSTHILLKIPAIIFSIIGFIVFVVPVLSTLILGMIKKSQDTSHFVKTENKAYLKDENWRDGFEYKGQYLVKGDFLSNSKKANLVEEGVIITPEDKKYYLSHIDNDKDFNIYRIEKITYGIYCDQAQYDEIYEYYHDPDNLNTKIVHTDNETGQSETKEIDFDATIIFEIRELYDTQEAGVYEVKLDDMDFVKNGYDLVAASEDGLFYESVMIDEIDGRYLLSWKMGYGQYTALYLTDELEDYVRELFKTCN